jgi:hypothetical protein
MQSEPLADDICSGVPEIAAEIGYTERATYHAVAKGQIPVFRIGKKIHARRSELRRRFSSDAAPFPRKMPDGEAA